MKNQTKNCRNRSQAGFTLIEIMVSIAIGLIVVTAALSAYLGAAQLNRAAAAQSLMNEDGQAALALLTREIRMAGSNPVQLDRGPLISRNPVYEATAAQTNYTAESAKTGAFTVSDFSLRGCTGLFIAGAPGSAANTIDNLTCGTGNSDVLALSYEADIFNTTPALGLPTGLPTDCTGTPLSVITVTPPAAAPAPGNEQDFELGAAAVTTYSVADNRYFVATVGGNFGLFCQGSGAAQLLIENVESLTLLYGVAHPISGVLAGYLSADGVANHPGLDPLTLAQRWARVVTVQICLVVRSDASVLSDAASARFLRCDGTLEDNPGDLRLRRAYSTTVVLRNRFI
jgi:type IV pilus assembly protein PilW